MTVSEVVIRAAAAKYVLGIACLRSLGGLMPTTVYFATNRVVNGSPNDWHSFGTSIVAPSDPTAMTYATAFVDNANLTADTTGAIEGIQNIHLGSFSAD